MLLAFYVGNFQKLPILTILIFETIIKLEGVWEMKKWRILDGLLIERYFFNLKYVSDTPNHKRKD